MNKVNFYFIVSITALSLFSCQKDDPPAELTPPRLYAEQYITDIADIEEYLNTYYITVVNNPGKPDDQDVTFTKKPDGGPQPTIMSYKNNAFAGSTVFPQLRHRDVNLHNVPYKLYYLVLRPGIGESPCNVDGVFTAYRGDYLSRDATTKILSTTKFDENKFPQNFLSLFSTNPNETLISGWGEILPKFKTGTYSTKGDGTVSYNDFGAGVMFLPSGYGYYNRGSAGIPAYAPLVFSFKLYEIRRLDHDNDGIPSFQEDFNTIAGDEKKDGYMYDYRNPFLYPTPSSNPDNSDTDAIPDFLDSDDDGDNFTTKLELKKPDGTYHTFETVPSCSGKSVKRHLTSDCKPPYTN